MPNYPLLFTFDLAAIAILLSILAVSTTNALGHWLGKPNPKKGQK